MTARYWRVSPKFWTDAEEWSDDTRLLALYVLTCEHRTTEGLFRLPLKYMAADLGWSVERVSEAFAQLLKEGFVQHDPDRSLVLIVNAMKYQSPENPNQVKHALRMLETVPNESPLTSTFKGLAERLCPRLAKALPEGFGKPPAPTPSPSPSRSESFTDDNKTEIDALDELSTDEAIARMHDVLRSNR